MHLATKRASIPMAYVRVSQRPRRIQTELSSAPHVFLPSYSLVGWAGHVPVPTQTNHGGNTFCVAELRVFPFSSVASSDDWFSLGHLLSVSHDETTT